MGKQISPVAFAYTFNKWEGEYCINAVMFGDDFELEYYPLALVPSTKMSEEQVKKFVVSLNEARDRVIYRRVSI